MIAVLLVAATGCGEDPTVLTIGKVSCDQAISSTEAKNAVERSGGRVGEDYAVVFTKSTRLGVVALIDGDAQAAYDDLSRIPGIAEVALATDSPPGTIRGFAQVNELVEEACGPAR